MILILVFVLIVLLVIYTIVLNRNRPANFPPGPPRLPIVGSYLHILFADYKYSHLALLKLAKHYNTKVLGFYLGDTPAISTFDWDLTKECFVKNEFNGKGFGILSSARGQGKAQGIFFVEGQFWIDQRRFSLSTLRDFGFGRRLQCFEEVVGQQVKELVDLLQNKPIESDSDVHRNIGEVLVPDIFFGYFMNCMWYILSGSFHDQHDLRDLCRSAMGFQRCTDALGGLITLAPWVRHIAPKLSGYQAAVDDNYDMYLYCKKFVDEHLETYAEEHMRDFIDVYISKIKEHEAEGVVEGFHVEQLIFMVLDYMFPAGVAMGHSVNFVFGYLVNYPEIQQKMQQQIDEVVGQSRMPNLNDRINLPYVDAVIKETLRIEPANPISLGRVCTDDTTLGGYDIPQGTFVVPNVWHAHNDPKVWGDPENFRPERWLTEEGRLIKQDKTMGFGGGRRICAGETFARQTMFLFISSLLQHYSFGPCDNEPRVDLTDIIPGINMSLQNYWIKATPRT